MSKISESPLLARLNVNELVRNQNILHAARVMIYAHQGNETMLSAIAEVQQQFPDISDDQLALLWIGINAKSREIGETHDR